MPGYEGPFTVYNYLLQEFEAAAAVCILDERQGEAATAALQGIRCPAGAQVEAFGVTITEAITNANATHGVLTLQVVPIEGGSAVAKATLTLPKDSTEVQTSTNKTYPSDRTAAQGVAVGARLINRTPVQVPPGGIVYVEKTVAAGAAGGAGKPFLVLRVSGDGGALAASPVTVIAS